MFKKRNVIQRQTLFIVHFPLQFLFEYVYQTNSLFVSSAMNGETVCLSSPINIKAGTGGKSTYNSNPETSPFNETVRNVSLCGKPNL